MALDFDDLYKLIPLFDIDNVSCWVIYDEHPRDNKQIEVTICSKQGEVREYYKKNLVSSAIIPDSTNFKQIRIVRDNKCGLYYLVEAHEEIIILSRTQTLKIHQRFHEVRNYELCDLDCTGEVLLKIMTEDSVKYFSIDNGFIMIREVNKNSKADFIVAALRTKLTEAKYTLERNEKAYKQILNLRQKAAYEIQEAGEVEMNLSKPIVRFCNKKIVIILKVQNACNESLEKISVLIHNNSSNSITYTTKVFELLTRSPFYAEMEYPELSSKSEAFIAVVIPLKEFKNSIISKIEFNLVVSYQRQEKDYLRSCDNVYISASDIMGKNFDVFNNIDDYTVLAMLSTTEKTTLCLKYLKHQKIRISEVFTEYIKMELLIKNDKVAIHKHSPHHILYGMMIIFPDDNYDRDFKIDVYARDSSQVLALLHFIYDSIPYQLIVTTPGVKVTPKHPVSEGCSEDTDGAAQNLDFNLTDFYHSVSQQASMTLAYLDTCSSSDTDRIDIFAKGLDKYLEYRKVLLAEIENGIGHLMKPYKQVSEDMDVD